VIDTQTNEQTFLFGGFPALRLAFTPDGKSAYSVRGEPQISVVDVAANRFGEVLDSGGDRATDVAVTPDGRFVYVTLRGLRQLAVFEVGKTGLGTHPVSWSGSGDGIAITPDGATAYVADAHSRAVHVIPAGDAA